MVIAGWELHLRANQDWSGMLRVLRRRPVLAYQAPFRFAVIQAEAELMNNNRYSLWLDVGLLGVGVSLWLVPLRSRAA